MAAWVLTLPMAAAMGGLTYAVTRLFGTGMVGPVVVGTLILAGGAALMVRRAQRGPAVTAEA